LRQRDGASHADGAARLGLHLLHSLGGSLGRIAHGVAVAQIDLSHFGERQLARSALQQAHAQPRFQLCHAA
jgi:hypothetical protein